jgi:hypothetical protein
VEVPLDAQHIAQRELEAAREEIVAWVEEPNEAGREFGALRMLVAAIGER